MKKSTLTVAFALLFASNLANAQVQLGSILSLLGAPGVVDLVPISNTLSGLGAPSLPVGAVPISVLDDIVLLGNLTLPPAPQIPSGIPDLSQVVANGASLPALPNVPLVGFRFISDLLPLP